MLTERPAGRARTTAERKVVLVERIARAAAEVLITRAKTERVRRDAQIARNVEIARAEDERARREVESAQIVEADRRAEIAIVEREV